MTRVGEDEGGPARELGVVGGEVGLAAEEGGEGVFEGEAEGRGGGVGGGRHGERVAGPDWTVLWCEVCKVEFAWIDRYILD